MHGGAKQIKKAASRWQFLHHWLLAVGMHFIN